MKNILSNELIELSIDLSKYGLNTLIWDIKKVKIVLDCIEYNNKSVILGGDIYSKESDRYSPNGDNWYYNGRDIHESLVKSRDYLDNYIERNGNEFFVGLVIDEV